MRPRNRWLFHKQVHPQRMPSIPNRSANLWASYCDENSKNRAYRRCRKITNALRPPSPLIPLVPITRSPRNAFSDPHKNLFPLVPSRYKFAQITIALLPTVPQLRFNGWSTIDRSKFPFYKNHQVSPPQRHFSSTRPGPSSTLSRPRGSSGSRPA